MPVNDWTVGTLYNPNFNYIRWTQPGGPYSKVLPVTEVTGNSNLFTTKPFNELTGTYMQGCGHSVDQCSLQLDWDYANNVQVMLVLCPTCSYVNRVISPASLAYNPLTNAIIYP